MTIQELRRRVAGIFEGHPVTPVPGVAGSEVHHRGGHLDPKSFRVQERTEGLKEAHQLENSALGAARRLPDGRSKLALSCQEPRTKASFVAGNLVREGSEGSSL